MLLKMLIDDLLMRTLGKIPDPTKRTGANRQQEYKARLIARIGIDEYNRQRREARQKRRIERANAE